MTTAASGADRFFARFTAVFPAMFLMFTEAAMAEYETPDYAVAEAVDNIEIRDYAPMLLASVVVSGERQEAANKAFRILAGFIFGDNHGDAKVAMTAPVTLSQSEKIAMTAPVTQAAERDNQWRVDFMMPSEYTMETLPQPNDARIRIWEIAARRAVAIRFSGRYTDKNIEKHNAALDAFVERRGLKVEGPAEIAYYDAPFKPFFMRRNEIIYTLAAD